MRNKILIFGFVLLLFALPVLALTTIDFESPTYGLGNLAGQDGWTTMYGSAADVTVTDVDPISGLQSVSGAGTNWWVHHQISLFDKTSISMSVKLGSGIYSVIYMESAGGTALTWVGLSTGKAECWTSSSGTQTIFSSLDSTHVYQPLMEYDFINHKLVVSVKDLTTDTIMGSVNCDIPADIGDLPKYIALANWTDTTNKVIYDDIKVFETPVAPPASQIINFENPPYTTGNLAGQNGWTTMYGSAANVSVTDIDPIAGLQSASGTGTFWVHHPIILFDKTKISMNVKLGAGIDTIIYIEDVGGAALAYVNMNPGSALCWTSSSGYKAIGAPLNSTDVFQLQMGFDFTNQKLAVYIKNLTTAMDVGFVECDIPVDIGNLPKYIALANWNTTTDKVIYDDINVSQGTITPPPTPTQIIDFENPPYTTGNLAGQNGWTKLAGDLANLSVTDIDPIAGLQSASGTGTFWTQHPINFFDKTKISMSVKLGPGIDTIIYIQDDGGHTTFAYVNISPSFAQCWTLASGYNSIGSPLSTTDIYQLLMGFDFTNNKLVVGIKDLTTATDVGYVTCDIPADIGTIPKFIALSNWNTTTDKVIYDDIIISDGVVTPPPPVTTQIIDFESPKYTLGALSGQQGWVKTYAPGGDLYVSATDPLSELQSAVGNGVFWLSHPVKAFDKTSLSYKIKTGPSVGTTMYLQDITTNCFAWVRMSADVGLEYFDATSTGGDGTVTGIPLDGTHTYKTSLDIDFPNFQAVLNVKDMTTSINIYSTTLFLPAIYRGEPLTASVFTSFGLGAWDDTALDNAAYDDFIINETPAVTTSTLTGKVNLLDFGGDKTSIPVTVELNGTPYTLNLDAEGNFTILDVVDGTYDVRIKASHWLAKLTTGVIVYGNSSLAVVDLINGDVVDNNEVDFSDINATRAAYGSFPGDETWNERADVDGSLEVDFTDINIVRGNYGEIGD